MNELAGGFGPDEPDIPIDASLTYECLSATIPFEELYITDDRVNHPIQNLVSFPSDNLVIDTFSKTLRTRESAYPMEYSTDELEPHVQVCFDSFSSNWTLVRSANSKYERYRPENSIFDRSNPHFEFDVDTPIDDVSEEVSKDGTTSNTDTTNVNVLQILIRDEILEVDDLYFSLKGKFKRENRGTEEIKRTPILECYDPSYDWHPGTEIALCSRLRKTQGPEIQDVKNKPFYFTVEPKKVVFQFGEFEPFFCSFSLHDLSTNKKISETVYFENLSPYLVGILGNNMAPGDTSIDIKRLLFSVTRRTANIYLVLEVYKVFQGDIELCAEPYLKVAHISKQKELEKLHTSIKSQAPEFCSKFGKYRQPFGIAALQLFNAQGKLQSKAQFDHIYSRLNRLDLYGTLHAISVNDAKLLKRDLRGNCPIQIDSCSDEELASFNLMDAAYHQVLPPMISGEPVREVFEFLQERNLIPNFSYMNNMYLYPIGASLNGKISAKNLCVKIEVKATDDVESPSLQCIYAPCYPTGLIEHTYTSVQYRGKTPNFAGDEVKLSLPSKLSETHHILCTFLDLQMNKKKKLEKESVELIVGYAIIPLYQNGHIAVHNTPTCHSAFIHSKLEATGYLGKARVETKSSFQVQFSLVSTVYPEDTNIAQFLNIYHRPVEEVSDKEMTTVLENLKDLSEFLAIQYLPVIINNLLEVLCSRGDHKTQLAAFRALVTVLHKVTTKLNDKVPRNALLELYTNYIFNQTTSGKKIYDPLCCTFLVYMLDKKFQTADEVEDDSIFINSWFIFDLIIKSMVLELREEEMLNQQQRKELFDDNFSRALSRLLVNLTKYFKANMSTTSSVRVLNKNLALFVKDLLDILDRGLVLDMIRSYLKEMTVEPSNNTSLEIITMSSLYKFEFLRILSDHESYIPLNLPFVPIPSLQLSDLSSLHPFAFAIIFEVIQTMKLHEETWEGAAGTLYDLFVKLHYDARYQTMECKIHIASIHFVLLPLFLDNWGAMGKWIKEAATGLKREFYSCILFILENIDTTLFDSWWEDVVPHHRVFFLRMMNDIITVFAYDPLLVRNTKTLLTPEVALFMKATGTSQMNDMLKGSMDKNVGEAEEDIRLRWLTIEVEFKVLDIIERLFVTLDETEQIQMRAFVKCFCSLALHHPNRYFIPAIYTSLQGLVYQFREHLFEGENGFLRNILKPILIHCNSTDDFVSTRATTLLYLIFQLNQQTTGNFARSRIQTVASLSDLVGSGEIKENHALNASFSRLSDYAVETYSQLDSSHICPSLASPDELEGVLSCFTRNIQAIVVVLSNILRDTLRVAQIPDTGETHMKEDLFLQIAQGYKNTPDLRISWLSNLAKLHEKNESFVEAAMVHMISSSIIADYLLTSEKVKDELLPMKIFDGLSPMVEEYGNVVEEGACQSQLFTQTSLISNLLVAIEWFKKAEYFEYAAQLYKFLCPILEAKCAYKELSQAYTQLQVCWSCVNEIDCNRLFGKYFRVGFYGNDFGDLNRREYIYKEPKFTHILEMSERIIEHYSKTVTSQILTLDASKSVADIDMSKCFMQITHVGAYRPPSDDGEELSFFESQSRISEFVFETPFTLSGKAHAEQVVDQYKRKTILVVADSFPHLLRRLPVASKYNIIVSPIENAIEDVEKRNRVIETEIANREPKTLRQILQGSVLLQVNEGAVSVCKIFLGNYLQHPREHVQKLCLSMATFLTVCRVALVLNSCFCESEDDRVFQDAMEQGFQQLEPQISMLIRGVVYKGESEDSNSLMDQSTISDTSDTNFVDDADDELFAIPVRDKSRKRNKNRKKSIKHGTNILRLDGEEEDSHAKYPKLGLVAKKRYSATFDRNEISRSRAFTTSSLPPMPKKRKGRMNADSPMPQKRHGHRESDPDPIPLIPDSIPDSIPDPIPLIPEPIPDPIPDPIPALIPDSIPPQ